ncbi:MAG: methyl-accepting chemotaxis sensory transducer [Herbinix sp.]|jgi:methyl-accepting chemotaxis protein|nr:methyl-accepting chemotaxis sensory transducer [Herbinix sp.]
MKKIQKRKEKVNEKAKEIKEVISVFGKLLGSFRGIRIKILVAIFIPILLLGVFGIVCYIKTSNAITSNYEKSTAETIDAVGDYLNLGLESVQNKAMEMVFSSSVTGYYGKAGGADSLEELKNYNNLKDEVVVIQSMNPFVGGLTILGKNGRDISTSSSTIFLDNQIYMDYSNSDDVAMLKDTKSNDLWMGQHTKLDEMLGASKDSYAMSYLKSMNSGNGYIIFDISIDTIKERLSQIDYGKGSILGFVTEDGRETLSNTEETTVFSGLNYYQKAVTGEQPGGYSYQDYNGEEYLFTYSKIGETGSMVCSLIPKSTILRQADSIKQLIVIFVLIAIVLAIIVGTIIAGGIGNAIAKLIKYISRVSKGDLTVRFETKRKDEFLILSKSLNDMIGGIRTLISEVAMVGTKVNDSAILLSSTTETILGDTKDISSTVDEIEKGVVQQADDTQSCSDQMSNLSDKISQLYGSADEIELIAKDTKLIVRNGILIVDELKNKSKDTSDITQEVINEIKDLKEQSQSIGNFVGVINEIASQTNLLSLNASIEAARAGQAGRGFAVVADEIRKLADASVKAAKQIEDIVIHIQSKTQNTVVTAGKAENIVKSQAEALHKTVDLFEDIDQHVINLSANLNTISIGIKGIESAKEDTVDAISNISAVSEETAASAEEVSATVNNQIQSVESLSRSAGDLAEDANRLQEVIQAFQI